ncbi:MAG: FtsX-like permease family protein, partial [Rhodothermales bacterium]|nr:FtsX-like permease family protein [Rhodothermales bacterium]
KIPTMMEQVLGERYGTYEHTFGFQPITGIHLDPDVPVGIEPTSDPAYSYILGAIALFVLLIAAINFITLSIGRSADRAMEVGVRKAIGADRRQVMLQFWGEAVLLTALALGFGVLLAGVCLPLFNTLADRDLRLAFDAGTVLSVLGLGGVIALAAGIYPAAVLSGFRPVEVLKGQLRMRGDRSLLRRGLVVVQFALSIFLIAGTLLMQRQLDFLQTKNLGFDKEQVVVIPTGVPVEEGEVLAERFRNALAGHGAVAGMTVSAFPLDGGWMNVGYTTDQDVYRTFNVNLVDPDFLETMGIEVVAGRGFSRDTPSDERSALIINEAMVQEYGWTEPLGQRLPGRNFPDHEIIGVVADFNYESLRNAVEPAALVLSFDVLRPGIENVGMASSPRRDLSVRIRPDDIPGTLALLEQTWATVAPNQDFDFYFLDEAVDNQYQQEARLGRIVGIASLLAIVIACLGLFGLAALAVVRRTKEIGVRKVMGASVHGIVLLLSKEFTKLVLVAFVIAAPAAYFAQHRWLADFAYRVEISWRIFLVAGVAALGIAMLTVSYQAFRAALADPVKSLRYE